MIETIAQVFVVILIIGPQIIRSRFQKKYKASHAVKSHVENPGWEKALYFYVLLSFTIPVFLWLFNLLNFASIELHAILRIIGLALGLLMLWLFYLAHSHLGNNWSGTLEIRDGHQLVNTGLYKYVRHPMYMVFWLNALAQLLITSNWIVGGAAILAVFVLSVARIPDEEKMMIETFGDEYQEYMKQTKRLIPYIY